MEGQNETAKEAVKEKKLERKYLYVGIVLVVILVAVALIVTQSKAVGVSRTTYDNVVVPQALVAQLNVPSNISNRIGIGTASYEEFAVLKGKIALTLNGKPEIFYMGAEYCPFCAAERWGMVIALSRFGNFSNLHFMTSSASDYAPSTPTFTFYNSTYTSQYISFVSVELTTNQPGSCNPGYGCLQQPNASEQAWANADDPVGSIPFILFANKSTITGASYDPLSVLGTANWSTTAANLYNTSTLQSQSIVGTADLITAQICEATNETPMSVCGQPYVTAIQKQVNKQ